MVGQNQLTHSTLVGVISAVARIEDGAGNNVMDVNLSTQAKLQRYGRNITPSWIYGAEVTTPAADAALVTKAVTAGKTGYVYGFMITAQEANSFKIKWTNSASAKTFRVHFSGAGTIVFTDPTSIFEGIAADASTNVTINVVTLGTGTAVYQAALLYAEV